MKNTKRNGAKTSRRKTPVELNKYTGRPRRWSYRGCARADALLALAEADCRWRLAGGFKAIPIEAHRLMVNEMAVLFHGLAASLARKEQGKDYCPIVEDQMTEGEKDYCDAEDISYFEYFMSKAAARVRTPLPPAD